MFNVQNALNNKRLFVKNTEVLKTEKNSFSMILKFRENILRRSCMKKSICLNIINDAADSCNILLSM